VAGFEVTFRGRFWLTPEASGVAVTGRIRGRVWLGAGALRGALRTRGLAYLAI
jgi:hypothetical protein